MYPYLILTGLCLLVFGQVLGFDFIYYDDALIFGKSETYSDWSRFFTLFLKGTFETVDAPGGAHYRPLYHLPNFISHNISGGSLWGYHLSSLVLHILVSCTIYRFFLQSGRSSKLALAASAVFAVHPFAVEATAWMGSVEQLVTLFVILAFMASEKFVVNPSLARWILMTLMVWCALLSKEVALVLPVILILRHWKQQSRLRLPLVASFALATVTYLVLRISALGNVVPSIGIQWEKSMLIAAQGVWTYFFKSLVPLLTTSLPLLRASHVVGGLFVALALAVILFKDKTRDNNRILWGASWFFLFLLPTFSAASNDGDKFVLHDNRGYLPLIGFLIIITEIKRLENWSLKKYFKGALAVVILTLATISFFDAQRYKNGTNFWQDGVSKSPELAMAHLHYADMLMMNRQFQEAYDQYQECFKIRDYEPMGHNNFGVLLMRTGRLKEAEEQFLIEQKYFPGDSRSLENLEMVRKYMKK